MSEVLVIRLGSSYGDKISWMVWSNAEQEIIASGELNNAGELGTITSHGDHRELKILVPACDVTFKTAILPGKLTRQITAAIPYMLEEELAEDVDSLFFAIGDKTTKNDKPALHVATVDRSLMENWLGWLSDAGLRTYSMVPDALCLPYHEDAISGIQLDIGRPWLVRSKEWQCDTIDLDWFAEFMALSAHQYQLNHEKNEEDRLANTLSFHNYSPCQLEAPGLLIQAGREELPLKLLLENYPTERGFNLLQGEFTQKKAHSKTWETWRTAAMVAGLAIVLQLGFRGVGAYQLNQQLAAAKAQFTTLYQQAFPNERSPRFALIERQLKNKLKGLSAVDSESGFLVMLNQVGPVFTQVSGFVTNSIKYDKKREELRLTATGDGFQTFERFKSAVEGLGYQVQQGSLSNDGDKVVGAITIKRAG